MRHVSARLYKVTAPTIVLQAREDDMTSPHNAYLVHEGISSQHKQVMLLDDCYHVITVDRQKQAVVRHLHEFFSAHRGSVRAMRSASPAHPSRRQGTHLSVVEKLQQSLA